MPRKDTCHDIVKRKLEEEEWTITHDPYIFRTDPVLLAALGAERLIAAERKSEKIVVEIKSFLRTSQVVDLEEAIGKYSIYNIFLQQYEPNRSLWLEVGKVTLETMEIPVIVYSLSEKEPLIWKYPKNFIKNA